MIIKAGSQWMFKQEYVSRIPGRYNAIATVENTNYDVVSYRWVGISKDIDGNLLSIGMEQFLKELEPCNKFYDLQLKINKIIESL